MKTSNKILFITGLIILVILLGSVIGSRIFLNQYTEISRKSGEPYLTTKAECANLV